MLTASSAESSQSDLDPALGEGLDILPALDGDEGTELAIGEVEGHFPDEFQGLAILGAGRKDPVSAEGGEAAPQFRLKDDDQGDDEHQGQALENRADDDKPENPGEQHDGYERHHQSDEHVGPRRPLEKAPGNSKWRL